MRIYKPRGITNGQIVLVTILGVIGGIYIWKPLFEEHFPRKKRIQIETTEESESSNSE